MSETTKEPGSAAGRRIRVEVTAEDIASAVPGRACECVVARAMHRLGYPSVFVQPWGYGTWPPYIQLRIDSHDHVAFPEDAAQKARDFDDKKTCEPFAFDLEIS